jgi:heterotetrameric sarcosine oxidase gamma subunit
MRNRGEFWTPVPDWQTSMLDGPDVGIASVRGIVGIHLVSGEIGCALERLGGLSPAGPREVVRGERYALRLAPDRVLIVSSRVEALTPGWSHEGCAVSDVTEGMVAVDVTGDGAAEVIAEGTGYDFGATDVRAQESATLLFAGLRVAISRRSDGFRLHIERSLAAALWSWLEAAIRDRCNP